MQKKQFFLIVITIFFINIGCATNLKYSEHSPSISPDGKMLLYQSDRIYKNQYDVYMKYKTFMGWTPPIMLQFANSHFNTAGPFITYDQNFLILTSDHEDGVGNVDLWISERKGFVWGIPENMGRPINTEGYEGFASLSPDGKTLYFLRQCPEKKKYKNEIFGIFMSKRNSNGWSEPVKLPYPINSKYSEFGPIILPDGKSLIFSSSRPGGIGGYDLYKSEKMGKNLWTDPVNLGKTINTKYDDRIASLPAIGDTMYISKPYRTKNGIRFRIHKTKVPETLKQSSISTLSGFVYTKNFKKQPLKAKIHLTDTKSNKRSTFESNKGDGKFFAILQKGRIYDMAISKPEHTFYSTKIDTREKNFPSTLKMKIVLAPLLVGTSITLNNLYFKYDSADILRDSRFELQRVIKLLKLNPKIKIEISGHTDNTGSLQYNNKLSFLRANNIKQYLINRGIDAKRLVTRGYGNKKPITSKGTKSQKNKNRRVEIHIMSIE